MTDYLALGLVILALIALAGLGLYLADHRGSDVGARILPDPHAELHCLDDPAWEVEWEQRHRAQAARRRGQDLPGVDVVGHKSLDEIRRQYGGAS